VSLLQPGLLLLMALKLKGRGRLMLRSVSTVRGALLTAFGAAVFAMFFLPYLTLLFLGEREAASPDGLALWLRTDLGLRGVAFALLAYVLFQMVLVRRAWPAFVKADVDFLFPAPVTRRALLVQRLFFDLLVLVPTALLFGLFLSRATGAYVPAAGGVALAFSLGQLTTAAARLASLSERRWVSAAVWGVALGVAGVAGYALGYEAPPLHDDVAGWLDEVLTGTSLRYVLPPFLIFARALLAQQLTPDFLVWGGAALLVNLALAAVMIAGAPDFREAAIAASARLHTRMQALQRGNYAAATGAPLRPWPRLPMPPRLGGAGPIVWRQLVSTLRNARRMVVMLAFGGLVLLPGAGAMWIEGEAGREVLYAVTGQVVALGTLVLVAMLRFDFRNDMDAMHWNKTMPVPPWRVVLGQLAAPWLVMTAVQAAFTLPLAALTGTGWPLAVFAVLAPVNLLLLGLENTLYLLFPHLRKQFRAGDFQAMGRMYFFTLVRLFVAGVLLGAAAGLGTLAWWVTGHWVAGAAAGWAVAALGASLTVWSTAWAFRRFDPSHDTPAH
jgi:hypothetical protein